MKPAQVSKVSLSEGFEVLEDTDRGKIRDAALIAAQRPERYEMAGYG